MWYILFSRTDLQAALYDLVRRDADIHFGTQIAEVRSTADAVEVRLTDGRSERGDLLVGADGTTLVFAVSSSARALSD